MNLHEYFGGHEGEIEHIIPRSVFFDDSMSNKVCSCQACNREKNNRTGYDFMKQQGEVKFNQYVARVEELFAAKKISKTKRNRLMTPAEEIPTDFLERDLRQSQYIARKAVEILRLTCKNVYATSGAVTDFFRHAWGYDMILHNLNVERYAKADLVEDIQIEHRGQMHTESRIKNWSKRLDHRHHAIDALVIALTRQGYIQRLNNLRSEHENMHAELNHQNDDLQKKYRLLERWATERPHFAVSQVSEAVDGIAVSLKAGKKFTTPGKRYIKRGGKRVCVQRGLTIPRGELHEGTIYGRVRIVENGVAIKDLFAAPADIVNKNTRGRCRTFGSL